MTKAEMESRVAEIDARIAALEAELDARIAALEARLALASNPAPAPKAPRITYWTDQHGQRWETTQLGDQKRSRRVAMESVAA